MRQTDGVKTKSSDSPWINLSVYFNYFVVIVAFRVMGHGTK